MSLIEDSEFESRLARLLTAPDEVALSRDFVAPVLARVASRDLRRRFVLTFAGMVGAATTSGVIGLFWPEGVFSRLLAAPMSGRFPGGVGTFDASQGGLWAAALLALAVIAAVGLGGSVREK